MNDPNFESISKDKWKWSSRYFEYPLFSSIKSGIFLLSLKDDSGLEISIYDDVELQKKAQIVWDEHEVYTNLRWEKLGKKLEKSGFFDKPKGPIVL